MATYTTDKIEFGGNIYKLQDSDALPLTGGNVTGPVNFGDSVTMEEASIGDLLITGNVSSTNNLQVNTLNGVEVGNNPVFTDTVTTVTTSGSGNAVTAISASNGAVTVTKGTTFLTSHQDISGKADKSATVSTIAWDSTNKKLTKTINGTTTDVVTAATLRTGLNVADGAEVNQNAFSNVKVGSTTIAADTKTDTIELVAGDNITLTPDATNDKVTIAATDTTDLSQITGGLTLDRLIPEQTKTFTGVIGTANNWANATFFFGKILPDDYNAIYKITYRIYAECAGRTDAKGVYICTLYGRVNSLISYANWNSIASTSYRPIYHTELYRAKQAGITNGYGHLLGVRLYSSWNATTAANSRTIQVEILKCENCSFTFFNTVTKYSAAPGTGTTNYDSYSEMNAIDQGLQETGDANSYNYAGHIRYYQSIQAGEALSANNICVFKSDNKVYKAAAGVEFDIRFPIIWNDTAISNLTNYYYQYYYTQIYDRDLNTCFSGFTVPAGSNVYMVITLNGITATIDSSFLTANLPTTDDGKIYIRIGRLSPNSTNNQSYFMFLQEKPMFVYKNGKVRLYSGFAEDSNTVNGHTVESDVPSGAKFTDTTYTAATEAPLMDGTAAVGTSAKYARENHVHPTDTSRAPVNHASTATTYGIGTNNNYGHVKLSDTISGSAAAASGGTAATPKAVSDAKTAAINHVIVSATQPTSQSAGDIWIILTTE